MSAWRRTRARWSRNARVETRVEEIEQQFADQDVPRPPGWGGYRVVPEELEFWRRRDDRLHDRLRYRVTATADGGSTGSSPDDRPRSAASACAPWGIPWFPTQTGTRMRRSIDDATDDHPADDDERPPVSWAVALSDDCDACGMGKPRVVLTMEEVGRAGLGLVAHLTPATARRLRTAVAAALREIGEDPGP